jgi:hypothetical protein
MRKLILLTTTCLILAVPVQAQTGKSVTLTTYYPAPLGAYDRLTLVPRGNVGSGVGDTCAGNAGMLYVNNEETNVHRILFCGDDGTGTLRWAPLPGGVWTQKQTGGGDKYMFPTDTSSYVGIGPIDTDQRPMRPLTVEGISQFYQSNSPGIAEIITDKAVISAANELGRLVFGGLSSASGFRSSTEIRTHAAANWTGISNPGSLDFYTTPAGSTAPVHRMRISSDGNVGIGTATPEFALSFGANGSIFSSDAFDSSASAAVPASVVPAAGAPRSVLLWWPKRGVFRAGYFPNNRLTSIGDYSVAIGELATASGEKSIALGSSTWATGEAATAIGPSSNAGGLLAIAMGTAATASNDRSIAIGCSTNSSGIRSIALGANVYATETYAISIGFADDLGVTGLASGSASIAIGHSVISSGNASLALGRHTSSSGDTSTAMGNRTTASGDYSIAAGRFVNAEAEHSIVLGTGINTGNRLINNTPNSLMVGFNSITPSLFVNQTSVGVGGVTDPQAALDVSGGIRTRPSVQGTCGSTNRGTIIYNSSTGKFRGCAAAGWVDLH